jgi:AMP deaminase
MLNQSANSPDKRTAEPEAATPADVSPIPLQYSPMPATSHSYEMVDGVMHVYADERSNENLYQVGNTVWDVTPVGSFVSVQRMQRRLPAWHAF